MTAADLCMINIASQQCLLLLGHAIQTLLGITHFFSSIHLPHLFCMNLCSYRVSTCRAGLTSYRTSYAISVRQTRDLYVVSLFPHPASFRFHLMMDTLAFGYILPTTGRIWDFYSLETCTARHTTKKPRYWRRHQIFRLHNNNDEKSRRFLRLLTHYVS